MKCPQCSSFQRKNTWNCIDCGKPIDGGVVFITSISGSNSRNIIEEVVKEAKSTGHEHDVIVHDVGELMHEYAKMIDPDIQWDRILDADDRAKRYLRALAFQKITYDVLSNLNSLHIIGLHISFRWQVGHITKGFEPQLLQPFHSHIRCFINIIEDLPKIQNRLSQTTWGKRSILELLIWRDEELFLSDLFADMCGKVDCYAVANGEPPSTIERLIWHPEYKKVYLSFPITNILADPTARDEIMQFRDEIRQFLVVFDPYACRDYDETYNLPEMKVLQKEVGETTVERDYRFIDQANAVVVYFPRKVSSKGVDAEMNHARKTGKPIYLFSPEDLGGGPFAVPPSHYRSNVREFVELLKQELMPDRMR